MPILPSEPDCLPADLLDQDGVEAQPWWLMYTISRREKQLLRELRKLDVPHYCPMIRQRNRSPAGRIRTSYLPLFSNYVFVMGDEQARYDSICSGCVSKASPIHQSVQLVHDLRQIRNLIAMGVPLTVESRLQPGENVRVKNGPFAGYDGTVIRRENQMLLLVSVKFMQQGVSVRLEDCQLEKI